MQCLKDWFKKFFDENAQNVFRDYTKSLFRVVF